MDYRKAHSAPKRVLPQGDELAGFTLETMRIIAEVVGGTLGPGGKPVLIERPDDLPPIVTKDGVTVFKAMGFADSMMQAIMESTRDVAIRTANEAGDGTTTATILAEAIGRLTRGFCKANPGYSPNLVVRELEVALRDQVVPMLEGLAVRASLETEEGIDDEPDDSPERSVTRDVAKISANGDEDLAQAVMECYDICGDEGNVTLLERLGHTKLEVEEVQGYPLAIGYEDSLGPFYTEFLREPAAHRTVLKNPLYLLYHGEVREWATLEDAFKGLFAHPGVWGQQEGERDIVIVACAFSDTVLGQLAVNWKEARTSKLFPLMVPLSGWSGGRKAFLEDLAAVVGADVYDPVTHPLGRLSFEGLGARSAEEETETGATQVWRGATESLEVGRRWSSVFGYADPTGDAVVLRVEELRAALPGAASKLEQLELTERVARLSGGIARLTIVGTSNGDVRERKDRAEDAIMAVKGALRHGALYGGCWGLLQVAERLRQTARPRGRRKAQANPILDVLAPALEAPFRRLVDNVGITDAAQVEDVRRRVAASTAEAPVVFDAVNLECVDPRAIGLYDSVPAVVEAIRSSVSIATLHGTMGGAIVYARDRDLELSEARAESRTRRQIHRSVNEMYNDNGVLPTVDRE